MMETSTLIILIIILFFALVVTTFVLISYSGLFYVPQISIGRPVVGAAGYRIAYKFLQTSCYSADLGAAFTEVTSIVPKAIPVGIYYDKPSEDGSDKCHCAVGCIVHNCGDGEGDHWTVTDDDIRLLEKNDYTFFDVPTVERAVITKFPYQSPFSLWIAPAKVYPCLKGFIQKFFV
ncbi:unnamed protein product [Soboliphyme baturini]|uniref:Testis-expressed sequence 264 protein n=1 Tax=Soboliphyme baturini TaxID=241478 RepID=A0A183ICR9_9BILA|nr:unnamed protein product [Soboliphyme baturini]